MVRQTNFYAEELGYNMKIFPLRIAEATPSKCRYLATSW